VPARDNNRELAVGFLLAVVVHLILLWLVRIPQSNHPEPAQKTLRLHLVAARPPAEIKPPAQASAQAPIIEPQPKIPETETPSPPARNKNATASHPEPVATEGSTQPALDVTVIAPPKSVNKLGVPKQPNAMYLHRPILPTQRAFAALPKSIWRPNKVVSVDRYLSSDGTPESVTLWDNGDIVICRRQRYLFDSALDAAQLTLCFTVQDQR